MYFLVVEYDVKPGLAPPFVIFEHIFLIIRWLCRNTCCKPMVEGKKHTSNIIIICKIIKLWKMWHHLNENLRACDVCRPRKETLVNYYHLMKLWICNVLSPNVNLWNKVNTHQILSIVNLWHVWCFITYCSIVKVKLWKKYKTVSSLKQSYKTDIKYLVTLCKPVSCSLCVRCLES